MKCSIYCPAPARGTGSGFWPSGPNTAAAIGAQQMANSTIMEQEAAIIMVCIALDYLHTQQIRNGVRCGLGKHWCQACSTPAAAHAPWQQSPVHCPLATDKLLFSRCYWSEGYRVPQSGGPTLLKGNGSAPKPQRPNHGRSVNIRVCVNFCKQRTSLRPMQAALGGAIGTC